MDAKSLVSLLKGTKGAYPNWTARCPAHDDRQASLSVSESDDRVLIRCHAGCSTNDVVGALGLDMSGLFLGEDRGTNAPSGNAATPQHFTVADYATLKQLDGEFLRAGGLTDMTYSSQKVVRIPYFSSDGEVLAVRFRIAATGDKFRWKSGAKPCLYGLNRLQDSDDIFLVEGESDCHTLWFHSFNAVGIPGAGLWRDDRDARHLECYGRIYVLIEPDKGGDTLVQALSKSRLADSVQLVFMPEDAKDASALHCASPETFSENLDKIVRSATPLSDALKTEQKKEADAAWGQCASLARQTDILTAFETSLQECGLVGETRTAKLLYLAVTSRFLERPISVAVKGPSSGGKSHTTETVLKFFPQSAFYSLTAMSEHALAYSLEPLMHRMLVISEASGMEGDLTTYLIRSLLSEGCIRYETVEKTANGLEPRLIEREGPTGLLITTTALRLHPENETRLLSVTVADTPEQTAAIFRAMASKPKAAANLEPWKALQTWLGSAEHRVDIPYAEVLAGLVPPVATRLRRDFAAVLNAIKAHAILHQFSRDRADDGAVIADIEDYAVVRDLLVDLVSEGVGSTVSDTVRDTVEQVRQLLGGGAEDVSVTNLAAAMGLDKGTTSRRARNAAQHGYLVNREDKRGKRARYTIGDPMPDQVVILPTQERVLQRCGVVQGDKDPSSPPHDFDPFDLSNLETSPDRLVLGNKDEKEDGLDIPEFLRRDPPREEQHGRKN